MASRITERNAEPEYLDVPFFHLINHDLQSYGNPVEQPTVGASSTGIPSSASIRSGNSMMWQHRNEALANFNFQPAIQAVLSSIGTGISRVFDATWPMLNWHLTNFRLDQQNQPDSRRSSSKQVKTVTIPDGDGNHIVLAEALDPALAR